VKCGTSTSNPRDEWWLIHIRHGKFIWDMNPLYETWLIDMWHESFICSTTSNPRDEWWLIHIRHGSFIWDMNPLYETWLIDRWHDSFICSTTSNPRVHGVDHDSCLDMRFNVIFSVMFQGLDIFQYLDIDYTYTYVYVHVTSHQVSRSRHWNIMAHVWMSHGTHLNESWHTCEWVMAHIWMSHGTHVNESWHL